MNKTLKFRTMNTEKEIFAELTKLKKEMVDSLTELVRIPAISPESGGKGEGEKSKFVESLCKEIGFDKIYHYDTSTNGVKRPNLVAKIKGKKSESRLWIIAHLDVVPPGDLKLWKSPPFEPIIKNGKIFGRGTEDNGQDLIAALYAIKAIRNLKIVPGREICFAALSDEETISTYGMKHLVKKGIFKKRDFFLVPDGGSPDGSLIEIGEKSLLWLEIATIGKQCHASMPEKGINALEAGSYFIYKLKELRKTFNQKNSLYEPSYSSFIPTKRLVNVSNINTIPGTDTFYIDCRILPCYNISEILKFLEKIKKDVEKEKRVKIKIKIIQKEKATATERQSPIVKGLKQAVQKVCRVKAKIKGVGRGTCAAFVRELGYPAVVWGKVERTAHQPNEYAKIENLLTDSKVFASLFSSF